jgi:hypothetical protein
VAAIKTFLNKGQVFSGNRKSAVLVDPVLEFVHIELSNSLPIDVLEDALAVELILFLVVLLVVLCTQDAEE